MSIIHKFEEAGLGKAPFRLVGNYSKIFRAVPEAPAQPGACCDYCGTGIMDVYRIRSADGKEFEVGCDCVNKTDDKGLVDTVKRAANKLKTARRHEREKVKIAAIKAAWTGDPATRAKVAEKPHPNSYWAGKGKTLADYVDWLLDRGGNAGKLSVPRLIARATAPAPEEH